MNRYRLWLPVALLAMAGCAVPAGTAFPGTPDEGPASAMRHGTAKEPQSIESNGVAYQSAEPARSKSSDRQIRALARAARRGDVRTIDRLVNSGVDINGKFDTNKPEVLGTPTYVTPLYWAMRSPGPGPFGGDPNRWTGSARGFERLLQLGADPNAVLFDENPRFEQTTIVHASVNHPNVKFLEFALAYGGDPNLAIRSLSTTPIHAAVDYARKERLLMLLDAGGDIDALDLAGKSPVATTLQRSQFELALMLLERGASYRTGGLAHSLHNSVHRAPYPHREEGLKGLNQLLDWLAARGVRVPEEWCDMRPKDAWAGEWEAPGLVEGAEHRIDPPPVADSPDIVRFRDRLRSGGEGPEMVVVRGGRFRMGRDEKSYDRYRYCKSFACPTRDVTVPSFALAVYEVSFEEFDRFAHPRLVDDMGWGRSRRPVINVTWGDARAYVAWLSSETGETYRLPSEAEWEYAARAGTATKFPWGDELGLNRVNCSNIDGCRACGESFETTAPVGSFPSNPWGLHDMTGNVSEWTEDCWHRTYDGAPTDGSARIEEDCSSRTHRGGTHYSSPRLLVRMGSTLRSLLPVEGNGSTSASVGFRVARDLGAGSFEGDLP